MDKSLERPDVREVLEYFTSADFSPVFSLENTFLDKKPSICFGCISFGVCLTERCLYVIENHGN